MRMSIGENIQALINRWYAYGALMRAQHNNTKTDVRSLPYRVALRCEMGFFGFQQEMGRGSKWDTRGTQWYKVDVEGCSMCSLVAGGPKPTHGGRLNVITYTWPQKVFVDPTICRLCAAIWAHKEHCLSPHIQPIFVKIWIGNIWAW